MIPALRWAVMRAMWMFQQEVMDKVTGWCPQTTTRERRAEAVSNRGPSAYQPNALLLGQTSSLPWGNNTGNLYSAFGMMMSHQTKCHCKRSSNSKAMVDCYINTGPHSDRDLGDSNTIFVHHTLAYDNASPYHAWLQTVPQSRRYCQKKM